MADTLLREPAQPPDVEPLKVYQRSDQKHIVYDPNLPFGNRTAFEGDYKACCMEAIRIAKERSK